MDRAHNVIQRERLNFRLIRHHLPLAVATATAVALLFATRPYRDWVSRASFATAYPALMLLAVTLWIGPWNVFLSRRNPISMDLRRDIGIWAGMVGLAHAIIGQCVHLRGRPWLYYLYEKPGHTIPLRHDLFGWSNHSGLLGALVLLPLFATSNDISLRMLGTPRWKSLQRWNYACFVLVALHTILYQRLEKLHGAFVFAAALSIGLTIALQLGGVYRRRIAQP